MISNLEVVNRFIQGRNARNRNLSSRDGAIYTYDLKMGWKEKNRFVTIREVPSKTSRTHLNYLIGALYRKNLHPRYFDDICIWVKRSRNYNTTVTVGPYTVEVYRHPIKDYETAYIKRKGNISIRSPSLLKYLDDSETLAKKVNAIVKQRDTAFETQDCYFAIVKNWLYQKLRQIPAGNYGGLIVVDDIPERVIRYNNYVMRVPWMRGINKKTVKEVKDLLDAVPEEVKILVALA